MLWWPGEVTGWVDIWILGDYKGLDWVPGRKQIIQLREWGMRLDGADRKDGNGINGSGKCGMVCWTSIYVRTRGMNRRE